MLMAPENPWPKRRKRIAKTGSKTIVAKTTLRKPSSTRWIRFKRRRNATLARAQPQLRSIDRACTFVRQWAPNASKDLHRGAGERVDPMARLALRRDAEGRRGAAPAPHVGGTREGGSARQRRAQRQRAHARAGSADQARVGGSHLDRDRGAACGRTRRFP